jgi:hypothetical protein
MSFTIIASMAALIPAKKEAEIIKKAVARGEA